MITRDIKIRVRYKETDAMGIVHHSNYVTYYEEARTEMLRSFGTTYRKLEADGVMMPVLDVSMQYFSPAYYDDLLTVRISIDEVPQARMIFRHEILNEQGTLVNKGTVTLAFMNSATRRACRAPKWFREIVEAAMAAE